jgi:hypothetical protein
MTSYPHRVTRSWVLSVAQITTSMDREVGKSRDASEFAGILP